MTDHRPARPQPSDACGPTDGRVPPAKTERNRCLAEARRWYLRKKPVPPLTLRELLDLTDALLCAARLPAHWRDFLAVCLSNEVWRDTVACFPFNQRLLLLPQCLRNEKQCRARVDPLGLHCEFCGGCVIGDLQQEAERLGYVVLVAEGSPVVTALLRSGKVKAVVGVSCLSVLEEVFPYMEAGAVPGLAVPLLREGCRSTAIDLDWVWDLVHLSSVEPVRVLDLEKLKRTVQSWFSLEALGELMGPPRSETEEAARRFLSAHGKRWRPFLTVCAYQAGREECEAPLPPYLRQVAVAIECFHKASLVHDDIEDGDRQRYGEPTLHERYGVPVALNLGDLLLGEGYRLLAEAPAGNAVSLLRTVSRGHRVLCNGQGAELFWARRRRLLSPLEVIEIFKEKTAPAFEVALSAGAQLAGVGREIEGVLRRFSAAVGIAYQIRDDLEDWQGDCTEGTERLRPSLLLAVATERACGKDRAVLERLWRGTSPGVDRGEVRDILARCGAVRKAQELVAVYKDEALRTLCALRNQPLKSLLRRVIAKIFRETDSMECCYEHKARASSGGAEGSGAA